MQNYLSGAFWGPRDLNAFGEGLQHAIAQLEPVGIFAGDNLFTFGRHLSFLSDGRFMASMNKNADTVIEKAIIWRSYVVCWATQYALRLSGDFVECGCFTGTTVRIVCDYLDFAQVDKQYFVYDLFDHTPDMEHPRHEAHGPELFRRVQQRFADISNVHVIQGRLPEVLNDRSPEKIAFLHVDLNHAASEVGCLEMLFDRLSPGAILILDDYGWNWGVLKTQKLVEDPFFEARGYRVLELPTGQGLVIK